MQEKPTPEEAYIQKLFNERNSCGPNDTGYADSITSMIETVFASNYKFIYELLQNADDSKAAEVTFNLINGNLLVSHTGKHFSEADVTRICANASLTTHEKNTDSEKIGYKGVGFKAVFCISNEVTIVSLKYCLRFQKSHFQNTATTRYPWQIIPIPTSIASVEQTIGMKLESSRVHFLLGNVNTVKINEELNAIFSSLEVLLTLRHVKRIRLQHANIEISRTTSAENVVILRHAEGNKITAERRWYLSPQPVNLEQEKAFKDKLNQMNAAACPEKMRQAKVLNLMFAAQQDSDNNGIKACQAENNLYCYLPTNTKTGLPFLVNVDLLLSQDRTELSKNAWNKFALQKIGQMQFSWLASLVKDPAILPNLLEIVGSHAIAGVDKKLQKAYNTGFVKGLETAFIPSMTPGGLLTLAESLYDETGFWRQFFGRISDPSLLLKNGTSRLISTKLNNPKKLATLTGSLNSYGANELLENIKRFFIGHPNLSVDLLMFIKEYTTANPNLLSGFAKQAILLTEKNSFEVISKCYLMPNKGERHPFIAQFNLNIISPLVAAKKELCDWLKQAEVGLRSMTNLNIIRGHIFDLINNKQITEKNSLEIFKFIYDTYLQVKDEFSNDDFVVLQKLKVHRADNLFVAINECYLLNQGSNLPASLSISHHYFAQRRDTVTWNEFLLKLGVKTEICLELHHVCSTELVNLAQDANGKLALVKYYERFWEDNLVNLSAQQKTPHSNTVFINLIYFNFIHLLQDEMYAQLFWLAVAKGTRELAARCDFQRPKNNDIQGVMQYLKFDLKTYPRLKAVGANGFYRSDQLYSPKLHEDFSDLPLLYANVPIPLNSEQIDFFEFKKTIDLTACLALLDNPICNTSPQKLKKIYTILVSLHHVNQVELLAWKKTGRLLAADNTLRPAIQLIVNDEHVDTPFDSSWLHPCDMSPQQRLVLAKLFDLQRSSFKQDECRYVDAEATLAQANVDELTRILKMFLPMLAYRQSKFSGCKADKILESCVDKFNNTCLMYHERLLGKINLAIYTASPTSVFRFSGRWQKKSRVGEVAAVVANQLFDFSVQTTKDCQLYLAGDTNLEDAYEMLMDCYGDSCKSELDQLCILAKSFEQDRSPITNNEIIEPEISDVQDVTSSPPATPSVPPIIISEARLTPKKSPDGAKGEKTSPFDTSKKKNDRRESDQGENTVTGRKGEKYVYATLLEKYGKKYHHTMIDEKPKGFQVTSPTRQLNITWHNKGLSDNEDMGENHDIRINKSEPLDLVLLSTTQMVTEPLVKKRWYIQKNGNTFDIYWLQYKERRHKQLLPTVDRDLIQQLSLLKFPDQSQPNVIVPYATVAAIVQALVATCERNTRYIEVKATKGANKLCYISKPEWQKMKEARFRYQLFRVYEVNDSPTSRPRIETVRDPIQALQEEKLSVQMLQLSL